ncbi:NnrU family protein [bacterium]|nr:NnrU family protein [bacterium]
MLVLIVGMLVFLGIHTVPMRRAVRDGLVQRLGENAYKGLFTLTAVVGLGLIIVGKGTAGFVPLYPPVPGARHLALLLMPVALILVLAGSMPGNIKRFVPNPMLTGVKLWAVLHLLANGDLASVILFGGFLAWAVIDVISLKRRGVAKPTDKVSPAWDAAAVLGGIVLYGVIAHYHAVLFRMPVIY